MNSARAVRRRHVCRAPARSFVRRDWSVPNLSAQAPTAERQAVKSSCPGLIQFIGSGVQVGAPYRPPSTRPLLLRIRQRHPLVGGSELEISPSDAREEAAAAARARTLGLGRPRWTCWSRIARPGGELRRNQRDQEQLALRPHRSAVSPEPGTACRKRVGLQPVTRRCACTTGKGAAARHLSHKCVLKIPARYHRRATSARTRSRSPATSNPRPSMVRRGAHPRTRAGHSDPHRRQPPRHRGKSNSRSRRTLELILIPTQNDGTEGTPDHGARNCFGDHPKVGADPHGLDISTNPSGCSATSSPERISTQSQARPRGRGSQADDRAVRTPAGSKWGPGLHGAASTAT